MNVKMHQSFLEKSKFLILPNVSFYERGLVQIFSHDVLHTLKSSRDLVVRALGLESASLRGRALLSEIVAPCHKHHEQYSKGLQHYASDDVDNKVPQLLATISKV